MRKPGSYRRPTGARRPRRRWRLTPSRLGFIAGLMALAAIGALQWAGDRKPAGTVQYSYFSSCADARAKGAAPIRQGEAGYRPELDADGDGVACEPYFGG